MRIDDKEFHKALKKIGTIKGTEWEDKAARQLLVLSRREVPFGPKTKRSHGGNLQKSGFVDRDKDGAFVAYTEEYAAYQHEGVRADGTFVVRNWTGGRKKKYLEDPLKQNLDKWRKMAIREYKKELKSKK